MDRHAMAGLWSRRGIFWAGAGLPLLAGCSSDPNSDGSGIFGMMRESVGGLSGNGAITRQQAAAVPFASIGMRMGDSAQSLLVLATRTHDVCMWTSAAHIAIETTVGRITRTAGLEHNSSQVIISGSDPLQSGARSGNVCQYAMDLSDRNIFQAPIRYEIKSASRDETIILGGSLKVFHLQEHGSCQLFDWEFENEYWLDAANGFVWRSRQNVHPDLDPIELEVLRPPG